MQAYKIMHGLWGMGQMIPRLRDQIPRGGGRRRCLRTATIMHNTSEVLFCLCANTDPQRACRAEACRRRDSIFIPQSRDPVDALMWRALDFSAAS